MLTHRQLEIAERLFDLDPVQGYPERGARHVADLVGAHGYRLILGDQVFASSPKPTTPPIVTLPLSPSGDGSRVLQLHGPPLDEAAQRLASWGAALLARGLRYAHRLDGSAHQRTYEDVQAMLERTPLTPRERDVVGRLLSGASTRQIAKSTGLTVATVNTYLKRIFAKLGVHSRVELVARITGTRGVIPSEPLSDSPSPSRPVTPPASTE